MKKYFTIIAFTILGSAAAQVKGNKEIVSKEFAAVNLSAIEISLYADIRIDCQAEPGIQITADANLIELIDFEVVDGRLKLDQKKWIQPSQKMRIEIGAPELRSVQISTNDKARIVNLNRDVFSATALNGTLELQGKVTNLNVNAENGTVDASDTENANTNLNIWGPGKAILNTSQVLNAKLSKEARLELRSSPEKTIGTINQALKNAQPRGQEVRYIDFKIRNNSKNRVDFYVIGPKPDGNNFSYGFPMAAGKVRKERWTTGTKVYKVGSLGLRKILLTIKASDEDRTLDLFRE